jgi:hypothetical protein
MRSKLALKAEQKRNKRELPEKRKTKTVWCQRAAEASGRTKVHRVNTAGR